MNATTARIEKRCQRTGCGALFVVPPLRRRQKYCSTRCRRLAALERRIPPPPTGRIHHHLNDPEVVRKVQELLAPFAEQCHHPG